MALWRLAFGAWRWHLVAHLWFMVHPLVGCLVSSDGLIALV
jgi:hypothetical protein